MSIRFRLTIAVIAVILVVNSLLSFLALQYLGSVWMGEVQTRVRRKSASARAAYQQPLGGSRGIPASHRPRSHDMAAAVTRLPAAAGSDVAGPRRVKTHGLCGLNRRPGKGDLPVGKRAKGRTTSPPTRWWPKCCATAGAAQAGPSCSLTGGRRPKGPSWPSGPYPPHPDRGRPAHQQIVSARTGCW